MWLNCIISPIAVKFEIGNSLKLFRSCRFVDSPKALPLVVEKVVLLCKLYFFAKLFWAKQLLKFTKNKHKIKIIFAIFYEQ